MKISTFVQKSPLAGIMATQLKLSAFLDKKLTAVGLNYLESMVLTTLFFEDKDKTIGPSQISRSILYPLPRISTALSRLQRNGFISREIVSSDSRRTRLYLTAKGSKRAIQVIGIFNAIQESIEKVAGENQSIQMNKTLLKLREQVF